jgi:hypothetical protein
VLTAGAHCENRLTFVLPAPLGPAIRRTCISLTIFSKEEDPS